MTDQESRDGPDSAAPLSPPVIALRCGRGNTTRCSGLAVNDVVLLRNAGPAIATGDMLNSHKRQRPAFACFVLDLQDPAAPRGFGVNGQIGEILNTTARPHPAGELDGGQKAAPARMTIEAQHAATRYGIEEQP